MIFIGLMNKCTQAEMLADLHQVQRSLLCCYFTRQMLPRCHHGGEASTEANNYCFKGNGGLTDGTPHTFVIIKHCVCVFTPPYVHVIYVMAHSTLLYLLFDFILQVKKICRASNKNTANSLVANSSCMSDQ